jgi:formate hydrogenlyase subunit 6/NADH:ubiquinone oxidoreductase subunit I
MMICPAPSAIEVLKVNEDNVNEEVWKPFIYPGHCLRCGLCVEVCPEEVLKSGDISERVRKDGTYIQFSFHVLINQGKCIGCGTCALACPVNREIDPILASKGTVTSNEVIMRTVNGMTRVLHEEKCTGCKTCEENCFNQAISIARVVEFLQYEKEDT